MKKLAVIGIDPGRLEWLQRIGKKRGFEVRPLLAVEQVHRAPRYDIEELLEQARDELGSEPVDGLTTFWDFPSSCLVPLLAAELSVPTASLRSVVAFEHKYWSRLTQHRIAPADTPPFAAVDVFDDGVLDEPPLPYPFWLKPVKSKAGHLGFRISDWDDYRYAIEAMRTGIHRLGRPFQQAMDRLADLPDEVAAMGGTLAIAEGIIDGRQCTLEGHVYNGEVEVHGIFDIHRAEDRSTFTHYTYPSRLPDEARTRMGAIASDLVSDVGYDDACFNIEFFVDEAEDRTWILEVNPRISQEHSHLMGWVDGATNLEVMAQTALGERPALETRTGNARIAGKFFVRHDRDAVVGGMPDQDAIDELQERFAPCLIELVVDPGDRLSELHGQEPFSYVLAYVHLAAASEEELHDRYEQVRDALDLQLDPVG